MLPPLPAVAARGTAARNVISRRKATQPLPPLPGLHRRSWLHQQHGNKTPEKDNISETAKNLKCRAEAALMPRLLQRLALFLLTLVFVGNRALYALYFRRTPLPATLRTPRVVPAISTIPGIAACWVETGKTFRPLFLRLNGRERPSKTSRGRPADRRRNSSHFDDEIRGFPFGTWLQLKSLAGELKAESPLPQLLRQVGEDPAKLRWAILSQRAPGSFRGLMICRLCQCC